ncbi:uncharacterized protein [Euphorbia lathyris]|uniref:uncharacterized protein isoform X2 n=1 Tax=Euphorbia lathyris TaxID=212925 RepID=UPI0033143BFA
MCPISVCTCEASEMCVCLSAKKAYESHNADLLVKFLMGLRDEYSNVKHQILLLDPLPSIHKAYSMIQNVEKQKEVYSDVSQLEIATHTSGNKPNVPTSSVSTRGQKRDSSNKADRFCTNCNKPGHEKDTCFKLHGYPDWFQEFKKKSKSSKPRANCVSYPADTPLDYSDSEVQDNKENFHVSNFTVPPGFAQLVQNEKVMKSKMNYGDDGHSLSPAPLSNFSGFAGPTF